MINLLLRFDLSNTDFADNDKNQSSNLNFLRRIIVQQCKSNYQYHYKH